MKQYPWKEAQNIINSGNVYLWFGSTWCKDCVEMLPIVEELEEECIANDLNIKFIKVDADEAGIFRDKNHPLKVEYIPTHIFMKNGKIVERLYEIQTKELLYSKIQDLINL